jgi:hypothetical protein
LFLIDLSKLASFHFVNLQVGAVEKCEGDINGEMAALCGFASVVEFAAAVRSSVVHVLLALWKVSARI